MATYRNVADEPLGVGLGLPTIVWVAPDETFDVPEEAAQNYDQNVNFVRVDTPAVVDEPLAAE